MSCFRVQLLPLIPLLLSVAAGDHIAHAASPARQMDEARIARCIRNAAQGKTWLEKTLWGLRDQEGGWIGAAVLNVNGSHDLGPLQVNTWWVPRIASLVGQPTGHVRYWLQQDPCFNAQVARWIFLSALATSGDYWTAVGIYHSPTRWRQRRYAASVASKLKIRFGEGLFRQRDTRGADAGGLVASPKPRSDSPTSLVSDSLVSAQR